MLYRNLHSGTTSRQSRHVGSSHVSHYRQATQSGGGSENRWLQCYPRSAVGRQPSIPVSAPRVTQSSGSNCRGPPLRLWVLGTLAPGPPRALNPGLQRPPKRRQLGPTCRPIVFWPKRKAMSSLVHASLSTGKNLEFHLPRFLLSVLTADRQAGFLGDAWPREPGERIASIGPRCQTNVWWQRGT